MKSRKKPSRLPGDPAAPARVRASSRSAEKKPAPRTSRDRSHNVPTPSAPQSPLIVGVGASAGGLEAFTELLRALPADTGMAFVLVQHLEPKHESVLTQLLARATRMPVREVRDGMRAESNHVYVIPANVDLNLVDGLLHIERRQAPAGRHFPIDYFFRSLAETSGPRAIGVILSGTASDGTEGLKRQVASLSLSNLSQANSTECPGARLTGVALI
jgi:two-component system, chemotaxis family, CheB/CheR fusion protein